MFVLLRRFSGLPGPRPNEKLAWAVARAIGVRFAGRRAAYVISRPRDASRKRGLRSSCRSSERSAWPFVSRRARAPRARARPASLSRRRFASSRARRRRHGARRNRSVGGRRRRRRTRDPGPMGTFRFGRPRGHDGAIVARRAPFVRRRPLEIRRSFFAPRKRAARRSALQGYRDLLKTLPKASARLVDRFADATMEWLESKASTEHVELREALATVAQRIASRGHAPGRFERSKNCSRQAPLHAATPKPT